MALPARGDDKVREAVNRAVDAVAFPVRVRVRAGAAAREEAPPRGASFVGVRDAPGGGASLRL